MPIKPPMIVITPAQLTRAIMNSVAASKHEVSDEAAHNMAMHLLNFFGFSDQIIDNILEPEDRDLFYMLEDGGVLRTDSEELTIHDGRDWKIHYWCLDKVRILKEAPEQQKASEDELIQQFYLESVPEKVWNAMTPPICTPEEAEGRLHEREREFTDFLEFCNLEKTIEFLGKARNLVENSPTIKDYLLEYTKRHLGTKSINIAFIQELKSQLLKQKKIERYWVRDQYEGYIRQLNKLEREIETLDHKFEETANLFYKIAGVPEHYKSEVVAAVFDRGAFDETPIKTRPKECDAIEDLFKENNLVYGAVKKVEVALEEFGEVQYALLRMEKLAPHMDNFAVGEFNACKAMLRGTEKVPGALSNAGNIKRLIAPVEHLETYYGMQEVDRTIGRFKANTIKIGSMIEERERIKAGCNTKITALCDIIEEYLAMDSAAGAIMSKLPGETA